MTDRPILFSGPMVRAILGGRKTVTRRAVRPQPADNFCPLDVGPYHPLRVSRSGEECAAPQRFGAYDDQDDYPAPHAPGDRLWVRETWGLHIYGDYTCWNRDSVRGLSGDDVLASWEVAYAADALSPHDHWRPSIHMPRWASRITLDVVSVRLERLQDITEEDARREGVSPIGAVGCECETEVEEPAPHLAACGWSHIDVGPIDTPHLAAFAVLWDQLNAGRGYGWESDPFVWRIEFRRVA